MYPERCVDQTSCISNTPLNEVAEEFNRYNNATGNRRHRLAEFRSVVFFVDRSCVSAAISARAARREVVNTNRLHILHE
jgi:hypothetical protein